ncbi:MAG: FdtA/QdtA family cupin domain-containing protein [Muribaculaceae bacterium]|nr:FdtA/QdtA family cupin domain-containing protein [Muribaculaceae bacterium]
MEYDAPHIIDISKIQDARGNLSVLEYPGALSFTPQRIYWIYDVPTDRIRHGHAYYTQHEVIVALSGSFEVLTYGVNGAQRFRLSKPWEGLYIPPLTWREIDMFSSNAVALIAASTLYDESDYIRCRETFNEIAGL